MKIDPNRYTPERLEQIVKNCPPKISRIAALAYATGARVSELNKITKEDILENEGYLEISCPVLKKRKPSLKHIKRIALVRMDEEWLVNRIKQLIKITPDFKPLVDENRITLYRWLKENTGINPHGFRAIRATHLAKKGFTAHQLKQFFGWSSVTPSDFYVVLNTKDLRY